MKIAYIDDDQDGRAILAVKLTAEGIACDQFGSAEEALPHMVPGAYDALIIDIRLPRLSGTQLLQRLRQRHVHSPCLLITAFNNMKCMRQALNAGANYLIEKPFTYRVLRRVIEKIAHDTGSIQHQADRGLEKLGLTGREAEVARYLLKGLSNDEIARMASLSEKTVKQHIGRLFQKANVASRGEFFASIFPV